MNSSRCIMLAPTLTALILGAMGVEADDENGENRGRDLYQAHGCYACHGYNGVGKHMLSLETSGIVASEEVFLAFLRARAEVRPLLPKQNMPHYPASSLSDNDAREILTYIRSFEDSPPSVGESETLSAILDSARTGSR